MFSSHVHLCTLHVTKKKKPPTLPTEHASRISCILTVTLLPLLVQFAPAAYFTSGLCFYITYHVRFSPIGAGEHKTATIFLNFFFISAMIGGRCRSGKFPNTPNTCDRIVFAFAGW